MISLYTRGSIENSHAPPISQGAILTFAIANREAAFTSFLLSVKVPMPPRFQDHILSPVFDVATKALNWFLDFRLHFHMYQDTVFCSANDFILLLLKNGKCQPTNSTEKTALYDTNPYKQWAWKSATFSQRALPSDMGPWCSYVWPSNKLSCRCRRL